MSENKTSFYITTPIFYVNDNPHIGHVYTSIAADVLARFRRLQGRQVHFLTGTDEHGLKVAQKAQEKGLDPQAYVDQISENFRNLTPAFNISNDDFIRTSESRHKKAVRALWKKLVDADQIYLGSYAGWYAVRDEAFYAESELLKNEKGEYYHPVSGAKVEWVEEPSYFFRLSRWQEPLLKYYEEHPEAVQPDSRRNEIVSFIRSGLTDLSISRTTFTWGIPVPGDEKHIIYVWIDALTNYISALGYPDEDADLYKKFWPADVHLMGKDITRFHAVYWPAMLMAAGLPPPRQVFAHGWWTNEGQKISKSLGNVIDPYQLKSEFGLDAFRYFLLREVSFGQDGDFSRSQMISRSNTDLSNDLGNLGQRTLAMIQRNCESRVPESHTLTADDVAFLKLGHTLYEKLQPLMDQLAFDKALREIWEVIAASNRYIDSQAPWALRKTDFSRMETVLACLLESLRSIGLMILPFMPEAATRLLDQLAVPADQRAFQFADYRYAVPPGTVLPVPQPLFPRYVEEAA